MFAFFAGACKKSGKPPLFLHVGPASAAAVVVAAAVIVVAVPDDENDDENCDPPPAVAKGADTGRITRHIETS